jgi:hypothetical protein
MCFEEPMCNRLSGVSGNLIDSVVSRYINFPFMFIICQIVYMQRLDYTSLLYFTICLMNFSLSHKVVMIPENTYDVLPLTLYSQPKL